MNESSKKPVAKWRDPFAHMPDPAETYLTASMPDGVILHVRYCCREGEYDGASEWWLTSGTPESLESGVASSIAEAQEAALAAYGK